MLTVIIDTLLGLIMGLIFHIISIIHIKKRTSNVEIVQKSKNKSSVAMYSALSMLGFGLIGVIVPTLTSRCEIMLLFSLCLCIGWIDWLIRKIPNELLLALIISKVAFLLLGKNLDFLLQGIFGLAIGLFIFMVPSLLGIKIGAGDIKYAAVVGFYLGVYSLFEVMLVMALALFVYFIYLCITKKGNLKTAAAMGPYISLGVVFTALFPLIQ